MITLEEYRKASKELKKVYDKKSKSDKKFEQEESNIKSSYRDKIRKLKNKEWNEREELKKAKDIKDLELMNKERPLLEKDLEFKRIIKFIEISKKTNVNLDIDAHYYDYEKNEKGENIYGKDKIKYPIKPISILMNNKLFNIGVYVYKNRKPINKYTLAVLGRSVFGTEILGIKANNYLGVRGISQ